MPGAMDVGCEMPSNIADHGSDDRAENEMRGPKRLGVEDVERCNGRAPEERIVRSGNSIASGSDAARDASSIHDTSGISVDGSLGNIVRLMENAP